MDDPNRFAIDNEILIIYLFSTFSKLFKELCKLTVFAYISLQNVAQK